jgi:3-oxoacyl-[acyl-carrier-protein] synthase-3
MNGKEVYRFAVQQVPEILEKALFRAGLTTEAVDWLLLHQANQRILDAVAERLKIPHEKVLSNLAHYGNTSAATIPLMLDEAIREGQVKPGHIVAASGFGAGLSWGAAIFRYGRV